MNIKSIFKIAAAFAGVAAAIFVTDKVVDHIIDGKQEKASEDNNISCCNDDELDTETLADMKVVGDVADIDSVEIDEGFDD